jgi:hypothetical protein
MWRPLHRSGTGLIVAVCLCLVSCEDSDTVEAIYYKADLKGIYMAWVRDGKPSSINITNYVGSNSSGSSFFACTNAVVAGTNVFHCRFACRSPVFRRKGVIAISDEQVLLWIGDDSKIVVSPETKRGFEH